MNKRIWGLLMTLVMAVSMAGCTKDVGELIIGQWNYDLDASSIHEELSDGETVEVDDYTMRQEGVKEASITFKEEGTATFHISYGPAENYYYEGEYVIDGDQLTLDKEEVLTIVDVDKNHLEMDKSRTIHYEDGVTYSDKVHLVLNR